VSLDEILAKGVSGAPDVGVMATRGDHELAVLVWHYHDDDVPGPGAEIDLSLTGMPRGVAKLAHYRIDSTLSNSYAAWQRLGSPIAPDEKMYESLRAAGQLATLGEPSELRLAGGRTKLTFPLPRQAVSLLVFTLPR
jgi:xylan 1,4-beta-xylosidase